VTETHPIFKPAKRSHRESGFDQEEVRLANRNSGILLEALRYDVTPVGMHYLLTHFDVPYVASEADWRLQIAGHVDRPITLSLDELKQAPRRTIRVTMECAGNGRTLIKPRWQSQPWSYEAVSTAEWTGTPLGPILRAAGVREGALEAAFFGVDRGFDGGEEHTFGRSLSLDHALSDEVMLAWEVNGQPLPPQHGFPLRLIVPGWYGMASVKWLNRIEVLTEPFLGFQQVRTYIYRQDASDPGTPASTIRVRSLMVPPGIPDYYSRQRLVERGTVELFGRAWSGGGAAIERVDIGIGGEWNAAELDPAPSPHAWSSWRYKWQAEPGEHELSCRATTASGEAQPLEPRWDRSGFGNNCVQRIAVTVR
jgi:DMSO/TMAO reductase YedYZ molybdopterin-dependent catalytic subunit